jgi:hypothetical protein
MMDEGAGGGECEKDVLIGEISVSFGWEDDHVLDAGCDELWMGDSCNASDVTRMDCDAGINRNVSAR